MESLVALHTSTWVLLVECHASGMPWVWTDPELVGLYSVTASNSHLLREGGREGGEGGSVASGRDRE